LRGQRLVEVGLEDLACASLSLCGSGEIDADRFPLVADVARLLFGVAMSERPPDASTWRTCCLLIPEPSSLRLGFMNYYS
jgi:hypothetical protein